MSQQKHLAFGFNRGDYLTPEFLELWGPYPNKSDIAGAFLMFKKLHLDELENERHMVRDNIIERNKYDKKWTVDRIVPHLRTFLNQRRFLDDYMKVRGTPTEREDNRPAWMKYGFESEAAFQKSTDEVFAKAHSKLHEILPTLRH